MSAFRISPRCGIRRTRLALRSSTLQQTLGDPSTKIYRTAFKNNFSYPRFSHLVKIVDRNLFVALRDLEGFLFAGMLGASIGASMYPTTVSEHLLGGKKNQTHPYTKICRPAKTKVSAMFLPVAGGAKPPPDPPGKKM